MNKLTTFLLVAISVAIGFMASACTNTTTKEAESAPAQIVNEWQKERVGTLGTGLGTQADVYVLTDKDTNIDYIVIVTGASDSKNSCITPRLTTHP